MSAKTKSKMKDIKLDAKNFALKFEAENKGRSPHLNEENYTKCLRLKQSLKSLVKDFGHDSEMVTPLRKLLQSYRKKVIQHPTILNVKLIRKKDGIMIENSFDKFPSIIELKDFKTNLLSKVQEARKERKTPSTTAKTAYSAAIPTVGLVRSQNNTILNLVPKVDAFNIKQTKVPKTQDNYIGLELEFGAPATSEEINASLIKAKLARHVHLGTDGSVSGFGSGVRGHELRILVKEQELETIVNKVCEVLHKHGAQVNKSCGLHVHVDMRNRNPELVYHNLSSQHQWLYALVPSNRSENTYCAKPTTTNLAAARDHHYEGISAKSAYKEHKTFEIRIHGGTTNAIKIINWVKVILSIVKQPEKIFLSTESLDIFCDIFGIDTNLKAWMLLRINKFKTAASDGQSEEHA
jgi:hypothetical protein